MTHTINLSAEWQPQRELATLAWIVGINLAKSLPRVNNSAALEEKSCGDSETPPCVTGPPAACLQTHKEYTWPVLPLKTIILGVIK